MVYTRAQLIGVGLYATVNRFLQKPVTVTFLRNSENKNVSIPVFVTI